MCRAFLQASVRLLLSRVGLANKYGNCASRLALETPEQSKCPVWFEDAHAKT